MAAVSVLQPCGFAAAGSLRGISVSVHAWMFQRVASAQLLMRTLSAAQPQPGMRHGFPCYKSHVPAAGRGSQHCYLTVPAW